MAGIRRRRRVGDLLALEIGELLVRRACLDDDDQVVALEFLGGALDGERHGAGKIDRESGRPGREAADVQPARAHRLDLRRIRLHLVEHDLLVEACRQVRRERLEDVLVHGGILDGRVGEDDRRRILQFLRIGGHVGDHVAVVVAIHGVELAAVLAGVGGDGQRCEHRQYQARADEAEVSMDDSHVSSSSNGPRPLQARSWVYASADDSSIIATATHRVGGTATHAGVQRRNPPPPRPAKPPPPPRGD